MVGGDQDGIFINQFTYSKGHIKEYAKYFHFTKLPRVIFNGIYMMIFLAGAISLVSGQWLFGEYMLTYLYIAVPILMWSLKIYRYNNYINLSYKQQLDLNRGAPYEVKVTVGETRIALFNVSTGSSTELDYLQLKKKIIITKNCYILSSSSKLNVVLRKDSFVKGSPEGFLRFMIDKGFV
ncbi:MAG: hypothetical protein FWH01_04000 [Oscillospiraceae bacterium]|nr:hypothetical protein [Oscillospiraceae bacterium]